MSGHTPGPWEWDENGYALRPVKPTTPITTLFTLEYKAWISRDDSVDLDGVTAEDEANHRLIAAAPNGLAVAESTYLVLLGHPIDGWRIANQRALCELRDFIAKATGRAARDVQEEFEERAVIAKATGGAA